MQVAKMVQAGWVTVLEEGGLPRRDCLRSDLSLGHSGAYLHTLVCVGDHSWTDDHCGECSMDYA